MLNLISIARILSALVPIAKRVAEALQKDSDGGKKITEEEWIGIVLGETPRVLRRLEKVANGEGVENE